MDPRLYKAATQGNVATLRQLLVSDPRILDSTTPAHYTALHLAALHGHTDLAAEVLNAKEELLVARNSDGDTPLHLAARVAGSTHVAELLVRRASTWQDAGAPLRRSPDPLIMTNSAGNTPLHEAVRHRRSAIALLLLDADPNRGHDRNMRGESPLDVAAREGLVHVVQRIVDVPWVHSRVVPSIRGTALHQAVLGRKTRILEILLEKFPYLVDLTDSSGNNILHYAARGDNTRAVEMVLNKSTELAYKANHEQQYPLYVAVLYGSTQAIKALLRHCPDVAEMVDNEGRNAFHFSAANGQMYALQYLLRYVLPAELVNRGDKDGNTPLHLATSMSLVYTALILLGDRRVDPCALNCNGQTARTLFEINRAGGEMNAYEAHLRKRLKQQESIRCRTQPAPPITFRHGRVPAGQGGIKRQRDDIHLIIATLVATVSFAAIFTMPGGYNQTEGTAIHDHSFAFKIFVISNTMAMCSSTFIILVYLYGSADDISLIDQIMIVWGPRSNIIACLSMLVSFVAAAYITIDPKVRWPAYVVITIVVSTPVSACLVLGRVIFVPM